MKIDKNWQLGSLSNYELESWIGALGSMPVKILKEADHSASYETNEAHAIELENGKFALIVESGCSCYDSADADIELFPDEKSVMAKFDAWEKQMTTSR